MPPKFHLSFTFHRILLYKLLCAKTPGNIYLKGLLLIFTFMYKSKKVIKVVTWGKKHLNVNFIEFLTYLSNMTTYSTFKGDS